MRRRVFVIAAVLICLTVFPLRVSMAAQEIHLATSTVGGIYYMLGVPISQVLNKYIPEIHVTPEIGTGTVENLRLLGQKKVELGITLPLKGIEAITGTGTFTEKLPIRTLMRLTPVVNLFVVMADSPIKTHEDLKGKRVNLGQPGGLDQNSLTTLAAYGLTIKDIKPSVMGVGAGVDALKDGKFDAVITTLPLISQLQATHNIRVLLPDDAHIDKIDNIPGYGKWLMPANKIKGVDKPTYVPDFGCTLSASESMDPALAYKITKTLVEHLDELKTMFAEYEYVTKAMTANPMGVPHHPGAARYFKEAGLVN
jgi:TRAP transporter TAXI family solute receptor